MKPFTLDEARTIRDELRAARERGAVLDGPAGQLLLLTEQAADEWLHIHELATLVGVWRSARCTSPAVIKNGINWTRGETCDGDNHREGCAVKRALDDVLAAHNALGAPGMR